tara:strand:- start:2096 stop:2407 length:312 start_codon:yes stop_codon:yes gene_type:complete
LPHFNQHKDLKMDIKRKIVARAAQRIIGLLSFDELTAIYKAEQNARHASFNLGISSQLAAQDISRTVARETIQGLSDYKIDQMAHELKLSARDLSKYTAEVSV